MVVRVAPFFRLSTTETVKLSSYDLALAAIPLISNTPPLPSVLDKGGIPSLMNEVPREFMKEYLVNLRLSNNESPVVKTIIYRWVKGNLIVKIDTNLWQKIQSQKSLPPGRL